MKFHENVLKVYFLPIQRAAGENFEYLFFVIPICLTKSSCFLCIFPRKSDFFDFHMYVFLIFEIPYVRKGTYVYYTKKTLVGTPDEILIILECEQPSFRLTVRQSVKNFAIFWIMADLLLPIFDHDINQAQIRRFVLFSLYRCA